jgi:hypothetical protein
MPRWCALQDAALVRVVDRAGGRRDQSGCAARVGEVILQSLVETLSSNQLHAEIMLVLEPADLEDGHNVRMVQPGDGLGLVLKTVDLRRGRKASSADHLQGHGPIEAELSSLVDDPHAPFAENFQQLVVAEIADMSAGGEARVGNLHCAWFE